MTCTRTLSPSDDLRDAIGSLPEGGTLCLLPGTYGAPIRVEQAATLRATGPGVILDAGRRGPVFGTSAMEGTILLEGLVLQGGVAGEAGGAVQVEGMATVVLRGCTLRDNRGGSYGGGAIRTNDGDLHIESCRLEGNVAERGGAALLADGTARVRVEGSLITGNDAGRGAVVRASDGARVALVGTTLAGNAGAAALAVDGTASRAPELVVSGCIVDHGAGPVMHGDPQPPRPALRFEASVLRGRPPLLDTAAGNVVGDPELGDDHRPSATSPARGLWTHPSGADLHGAARPTPATAGALE